MAGADDHMGVVIAPETAEEAARCVASLRAGGFQPVLDHRAGIDRLANFPVLVPVAELAEAKAFLRGLRAAQVAPRRTVEAADALAAPPAPRPALAKVLPTAGRAIVLITGLLVVAGGVAALASMLQALSALRDH